MGGYDANVHSKARLGACGSVPVVPFVPVAGQLDPRSGAMHLRFAEGVYVRVKAPNVEPERITEVLKACQGAGTEGSYSGSGSQWVPVTVTAPETGAGIGTGVEVVKLTIGAGPVFLGWVVVIGGAPIVSLDGDPGQGQGQGEG